MAGGYPERDFAIEFIAEFQGNLEVNNSPGGKRTTRIYSLKAVDMRGASVAFEFWGPHAIKAEANFRF